MSTLVQAMACDYSTASHYLNQWWVIVKWTFGNSEILIKIRNLSFTKCIWKYLLRNSGGFLRGGGGGGGGGELNGICGYITWIHTDWSSPPEPKHKKKNVCIFRGMVNQYGMWVILLFGTKSWSETYSSPLISFGQFSSCLWYVNLCVRSIIKGRDK